MYVFKYSLFFYILLISFSSCENEGRGSSQKLDLITNNPNTTYLGWARTGLSEWGIGLNMALEPGILRNVTPGFTPNPPNWITVTGDDCDRGGIPKALQKRENCRLLTNSMVIGLCFVAAFSTGPRAGQIAGTTIIIRQSTLESTNLQADQKISIFTHEVGHCIGLQHWGDDNPPDSSLEPSATNHNTHVMYPSIRGPASGGPASFPQTPHSGEVSAVKAVYMSPGGCSSTSPARSCIRPSSLANFGECGMAGGTRPTIGITTYEGYAPCYYTQVILPGSTFGPERIYHSNFPEFIISAGIGNAFSTAQMPERGEPITGDLMHTLYLYKSDGTEEVHKIEDDQ